MASSLDIQAPVDGVLVALDAVPDPVFAGGTLGEGMAIDPLGDTLHAPCDGEIVHCARTAHAVTLRSAGGVELLIHLGLVTGLHARPAARLRAIAHEQNVDLELVHGETHVDARSLSRLMNLGLVNGDRVTLIARGECATAALNNAERLLSEAEADDPGASTAEVPAAEAGVGQLAGLVASQGLAVGPLHHYVAALPTVPQVGGVPAHEREALGVALENVGHSLETALAQAKRSARSSEAEILEAHLAWLDDPALREAAEGYIDSGRSAG